MMRAEDPAKVFYNDVEPQIAAIYAESLCLCSPHLPHCKQAYAAFQHISSTYSLCELDNAISVTMQERMSTQPGTWVEVMRVKASHSPFLSMPAEVAKMIGKAAVGTL